MVRSPAVAGGSDEDPDESPPSSSDAGSVFPGDFPRAIPSQSVSRPPSVHEVETHREHIRLNLENWEKQWADVLRYERAKVQDDADKATIRRALTRAGAALAFGTSMLLPAVTDVATLRDTTLGDLNLREILLSAGTASLALVAASLWYANNVWLHRRRFLKSRTRPLEPPERLDAVELLASLLHEGDPLYYRERDVDPAMDFGWKQGYPMPPEPPPE